MKKNYDSVNKTSVTFNDIYGLDKAKIQLREVIDYLKEPKKYQVVGARLRHGILLFGKPGTGKTMLAKVYFVNRILNISRQRHQNPIQISFT